MPKADLGVKRVCPETGKKFYDLNKDPIISPFTGEQYPLSYFEEVEVKAPKPSKAELKDDAEAPTDKEDEAAEDEDDEDAPELDEAPLDLNTDGDEDDDSGETASSEEGDDLEGFSDEEADLDDEADDGGLLLDDDEDDGLGEEIAVGGDGDDD